MLSKNSSIIICVIVILLTSCRIEKRKFNNGFYISFHSAKNVNQKLSSSKTLESTTKIEPVSTKKHDSNGPHVSSISPVIDFKEERQIKNITSKIKNNPPCDHIVLQSGIEMEIIIIRETNNKVFYRQCSAPDGPTFRVKKKSIKEIRYNSRNEKDQENETENYEYFDENYSNNQKDTAIHDKNEVKSGKSFLAAILLWALFGLIGIHRFYLGYPIIGLLYLLTFGFCMLGWVIDGILLASGNLKPKKIKKYDDEADYFDSGS